MAMREAPVRGNRRKVILLICLALLAAFVLFEIGARLLPADAVQYEVQISTNGGPVITKTGAVTDPATVARWRAAMTAGIEGTSGHPLVSTLIAQWRGDQMCAPLGSYSASYVFLWRGLPIESVSPVGTCDEEYTISRGGLPDLRTYYVEHLV